MDHLRVLPSAQARRGDENLERARNLRDQYKDVIPQDGMLSLQNRITMYAVVIHRGHFDVHFRAPRTTEMRLGLGSKPGLSKWSHSRAYRKHAEETLHIVKVLPQVCVTFATDNRSPLFDRRLRTEPEMLNSMGPKMRHTTSK